MSGDDPTDGVTLRGKALGFALEAVRFHAAHYQAIADDETVDEDTRSDAINDAGFLRCIAEDMEKAFARGSAALAGQSDR